jgi:hypothetical protein
MSIYTQYPIMTKQKQVKNKNGNITFTKVFRPFTQYFVEAPLAVITASSLLGYDATILAYLYLGSFSHSSLQILARSGWMGSVATQQFQDSQEMFDRVQVRALAGPLKDIKRTVPKPILCCLGCVRRVVVLLQGEPSLQSVGLSTLERVFIKDLSVLCSVHLCLNTD